MGKTRMDLVAFVAITVAVIAGVAVKLYLNRGANMSQAKLLEHIENNSDLCLLDVRSAREYDSGHVPGAINIGHKEVSSRLVELDPFKDKDVIVYCELGVRARKARNVLTKAGFRHVYHLSGDMAGWRDAGLATEMPAVETAE